MLEAGQWRRLCLAGHSPTLLSLLPSCYSGDLLHADGSPKSTLREEGVYSVNRRNELIWTLPLKAGEEKKLNYSYSVLVTF